MNPKGKRYSAPKMFKIALVLLVTFAFVAPGFGYVRVRARRPYRRHGVVVRVNPVIVFGRPRPLRRVVIVAGRPGAVIDFNIKPRSTRIYVDGTLRGTADDFDGFPQKMHLRPGSHRIRLETPDGRTAAERVVLTAGTEIDVRLDLR